MSGNGGVVFTAKGGVKVQIDIIIHKGDVAGEVCYLHLLIKSFVYVLFCRRVEESERSAFNCSNANDLSAFDFFVFAKLR